MRIFNAVFAGLITGLLLYFLVSLAAAKAALYVFLPGWAAFSHLFFRGAGSVGRIWSRACLVAALECLALPLASWVLPMFFGPQTVQAAKQGAHAAGQAFGSAVGGGLVTALAGYIGLFVGFILLATAYFSLKPARRKR